MPVPSTLLGALDLFAFCFLVIFGNVLDFCTYTNARGDPLEEVSEYDQNGIAVEERINHRESVWSSFGGGTLGTPLKGRKFPQLTC